MREIRAQRMLNQQNAKSMLGGNRPPACAEPIQWVAPEAARSHQWRVGPLTDPLHRARRGRAGAADGNV